MKIDHSEAVKVIEINVGKKTKKIKTKEEI